jgi:hypothetical protein
MNGSNKKVNIRVASGIGSIKRGLITPKIANTMRTVRKAYFKRCKYNGGRRRDDRTFVKTLSTRSIIDPNGHINPQNILPKRILATATNPEIRRKFSINLCEAMVTRRDVNGFSLRKKSLSILYAIGYLLIKTNKKAKIAKNAVWNMIRIFLIGTR